jgi:DNA-directed RNA polymerase subunit RPC12/RpoP
MNKCPYCKGRVVYNNAQFEYLCLHCLCIFIIQDDEIFEVPVAKTYN